jgi:phosphoribosylaminoimidazole-succinocarboxamide synthase
MDRQHLLEAIPKTLDTIMLPCTKQLGSNQLVNKQHSGKVREMCLQGDKRIIVTTDRISAFDVVLGTIPFKGQVLTQLSQWWFEKTKDIIPNHFISSPDPNVMITRNAESLPVEVIVRGFITGVTKTSLWKLYEAGDRKPYGIALPDGLKKNDPLPTPIITPTTKAQQGGHDERLTREDIIQNGLLGKSLWEQIEQVSLALFKRGQDLAKKGGLLLVDTKYEFGLFDNKLLLIDEIHTPDSSRYWSLESYQKNPENPESFDKEFLRQWFAQRGYRGEGSIPNMPHDFIADVAQKYIAAFETLTQQGFTGAVYPAQERIINALKGLL